MTLFEFEALPEGTRQLLRRARVLPSEVTMHPEYGLMMTSDAVRKLAAVAPDQERATEFMAEFNIWADERFPDRKRP
jgi:hypothetical protein